MSSKFHLGWLMSTFEHILVDSKGAVGIITLNRPKMLNALSFGVFREIAAAVDETALTADAMSNTIAAIRENTEQVADEIEGVGHGFDQFGKRLGALRINAVEFAAKVAA